MSIPDKAVEAGAERLRMDGHSMLGCGSLASSEDTVRGILEAAEPYLTGGGWFAPESLQDRLAVAEEKVRLLTKELRIARSEVKS